MMKKIIALLSVIVSLSFSSVALAETLKVSDVIKKYKGVIDTFNGVSAKCDAKTLVSVSSSTLQCSEFVKRYFSTKKNLSISNLLPGQRIRVGGDKYDKNGKLNKKGLYRKVLKSTTTPKVGDLASYNNGYHFAIVKGVSSDKLNVTLIEQNWIWKDNKTGDMLISKNRVVSKSKFAFYDGNNFEYVK